MKYIIGKGDTILDICNRFELKVNHFLKTNNLELNEIIYPGTIVDISRTIKDHGDFTTIYRGKDKVINLIIDALNRIKGKVMYITDISDELYDRLSIIVLGIAGLESNYGKGIRYNLKKFKIPFFNITLLEVLKKIFNHSSFPSLGIFQHKIQYDFNNNKLLSDWYKEFKINSEDIKEDISKMTVACLLRVIFMYKYNTGKLFLFHGITGEPLSRMQELLYKYNGRYSQLKNNTCTPELNIYIKGVMKHCSKFIKVL